MRERCRAITPEIIALRHAIHAHPETAFQEERTAREVAERLRALDIEVTTGVAGTGVVGLLRGGQPGPTVALRAEMDALPIQEQTGAAYASTTPGRMHACGHDGHTAILVGAAGALAALRAHLSGDVKLIFQPAEEQVAGASRMCAAGVMSNPPVAAIAALHGWPGLPLGTINVSPGPVMASADAFEIAITGRGGHGAMPHLTVDPVVAACEVVGALQSIASREVSPNAPVVVSVTAIHAGEAYNVIPEAARLRGTVRTLDPAVRARIPERMRRIAAGVCAAHEAEARVDYQECCPVTANDPRACRAIREAAEPLLGAASVRGDGPPSMVSEDFACYLAEAPGAILRLGLGDTPSLHNPRFDFPDAAVPLGVALMARVGLRLLGCGW
ncbi:MAG: amidohydrolase [Armatimonadetes bacterium]|nr:amidohydrolase [Armatimonadota bacterium]